MLKFNLRQIFSISLLIVLKLISTQCATFTEFIQLFNTKSKSMQSGYSEDIFTRNFQPEYDFVIVGGGPAGCVLANRLSENPEWKVLLIEAGGVERPITHIPLAAPYLQHTPYNWGYSSEPQENSCQGMHENRCMFPRGKGLGGTSIINFMIYSRGNRNDFDRLERAGNHGWSYEDILPYFKKSEHSTLENLWNSPFHGKFGPANVEYPRYKTILGDAFVEANKMMGHPEIDLNDGYNMGVSYMQGRTVLGERQSEYRTYIKPVLDRENLDVLVGTLATKIFIDPETKTASGVEFIRNNRTSTVKAKREVILSAGVFNSPQLLMLSGIGPQEELEKLGIPVIQNLSVGQNLQDHMSFMGLTFLTNTTEESLTSDRSFSAAALSEYLRGRGELTIPGGVEALSFHKTKTGKNYGYNVPQIEFMFSPASFHSDHGTGIKIALRMKDEIYNSVWKPLEGKDVDSFMIVPMLLLPKSVGYMTLKDKNPVSNPIIHPKYFEEAEDVETILEGIKHAISLTKLPAFQKHGARIHDIPLPNCAEHHFGGNNYWRCAIRTLSATIYHHVGTCKMGPSYDPTAVVSPELKVYGINKLRVADTSIIPEATTSHTNTNSVVIGEKLADMIKKEWF